MIDEIDRVILGRLQDDYRTSYAALGEAVGLSISAVNARVKVLSRAGILRGGRAVIEPASIGLNVCAFIEVLVERSEHELAFVDRMRELPEVLEVHHVTGAWSYLLKCRVTSTSELERLIAGEIKRLPAVARTQTTIALSSPKETSALDLRAPGDR